MTDTSPQPMNLNAFVLELFEGWRPDDWSDIDGGNFQDMLVKHGLMITRPATEEDCAEEWAADYGVELGDIIYVISPALAALRSQIQEDQRNE